MSDIGPFEKFGDALTAKNYELIECGDRHGSIECTWRKEKDGLHHFVVLAATPEGYTSLYTIEVWVGADDGEGFARSLFASLEGTALGDLNNEPLFSKVKDALQGAADRANSIKRYALVNRRYIPKSRT